MKNIFAKAAVGMLFVALISSLPAMAAQERGSDTQRKARSLRSTPRKANDIHLNCGGSKTLSGVLSKLNPDKAYTIRISGACTENVDIIGFQHLILLTEDGASITDASGGEFPVVNVGYTTSFEMIGFTINGGQSGVVCEPMSTCFFADNTFQNSLGSGALVDSSKAEFVGDVMQNNAIGLTVRNGSTVNIVEVSLLNNGALGAFVGFNSASLQLIRQCKATQVSDSWRMPTQS